MKADQALWVDNGAHLVHLDGRSFHCDRDIEAAVPWQGHGLLLSSDTDCLSLWDREGLVRTARVGVYPQDMAVQGDRACICGGADGKLHLLTLPFLRTEAAYSLPGMPERVCLQHHIAHVLTLLPEPEVHTALLHVNLTDGTTLEALRLPGLPGAITADQAGLWIGVSELVLHLPHASDAPDMVIGGIGLPRRIEVQSDGVLILDALSEQTCLIGTQKEHPPCDECPCV